MEFIIWGIVALVAATIIKSLRSHLEKRRIEEARREFENSLIRARIKIHQEMHGTLPTGKQMLNWHDELRGL